MKLVMIYWSDHYSGTDEWTECEDLAKKTPDPFVVRSVGWVIREDRKYVVLIANIDGSPLTPNDRRGFGVMNILKSAIVSRRVLE